MNNDLVEHKELLDFLVRGINTVVTGRIFEKDGDFVTIEVQNLNLELTNTREINGYVNIQKSEIIMYWRH